MKRFAYCIIAFIYFLGNCAVAQTVKQKVAVYVTGEAEPGYKKVIGSKLVSSLTRSDNYAAVERTSDFLSALNQEHDYQTSGAVSDNQIVKLGQQFGVRYVLVADVSEVFESMFISARMIDVQTGQITNSAEASLVVNSMDGLTTLTENIIDDLIDYSHGLNVNDIKIIGPLSPLKLHTYKEYIPTGYHVASKEEIEALIKLNKRMKKSMTFPIYADLKIMEEEKHIYNKKGKLTITNIYYNISTNLFNNINNQTYKSGFITIDNKGDWTNYFSFPTGFIYLIKNN